MKKKSIIHKVPSLIESVKFTRVYLTVVSALDFRLLNRLSLFSIRDFSLSHARYFSTDGRSKFEMIENNLPSCINQLFIILRKVY